MHTIETYLQSPLSTILQLQRLGAGGSTHRPLFLGLPYRILSTNQSKELLRGLWVGCGAYSFGCTEVTLDKDVARLAGTSNLPGLAPSVNPKPSLYIYIYIYIEPRALRLKIAQKPYIVWSLGSKALHYESLEP